MKVNYPIGGYAPGKYMCRCSDCGEDFMGDKRAVQCEPCAINALDKSHSHLLKEVDRLKQKIVDMEQYIFSKMR